MKAILLRYGGEKQGQSKKMVAKSAADDGSPKNIPPMASHLTRSPGPLSGVPPPTITGHVWLSYAGAPLSNLRHLPHSALISTLGSGGYCCSCPLF